MYNDSEKIMANRLTHIYTKTGDEGKTSLGDGTRVEKHHLRVEALGNVDEFNSIIGLLLTTNIDTEKTTTLKKIQHHLFDIGGELSIPNLRKIDDEKIKFIEKNIDAMNKNLSSLEEFILPGGSHEAALCHQARTVCRRAERSLFRLNEIEKINAVSLKYINRLSDFLFVLARQINKEKNISDTFWQKNI